MTFLRLSPRNVKSFCAIEHGSFNIAASRRVQSRCWCDAKIAADGGLVSLVDTGGYSVVRKFVCNRLDNVAIQPLRVVGSLVLSLMLLSNVSKMVVQVVRAKKSILGITSWMSGCITPRTTFRSGNPSYLTRLFTGCALPLTAFLNWFAGLIWSAKMVQMSKIRCVTSMLL